VPLRYFDDAIEEHDSSFNGLAHAYVDAAIPKVRNMGVMQHLLGNSYIDLDGDRAYVETYVWSSCAWSATAAAGIPTPAAACTRRLPVLARRRAASSECASA